ncbi:Flagellar M-ring protein [Caloramator mitchellensis]|uniref:Flagellar M-ring protein n=1 Tax=Caloramator mitchellensis TaxID=908809 RepID=A0A0R3K0Z3_CALMK|nr:flagellar basal-body MS-ring/collar protein FliF [Caloramator mitchellensis]KRQ87060.1 Flagellar M-ring protein [Caloramator mitchellensis]
MDKIKQILNSLLEKWKNATKGRKIAIISLFTFLLAAIIISTTYLTRVKYGVLFSNLQPQDSNAIISKLKEQKISYKIQGDSILVPESQVDELRLTVLENGYFPSSGQGWSLFDQSKFGVTDTEAKVMYQRALQDELARTIESFEEVEKARVHLVLPDETIFARESEKASASVTLKLKGTNTLTPEKVKAIVALISGSIKNLPKENVEVIDSNMNLLSEGLFDDTLTGTSSALKQREIEKQFEGQLQKDVLDMLESVFGRNKVTVKINADMDFDSKTITTISYDKDAVIRSQHKIKESTSDSAGTGTGSSPIDNNMSNTVGSSGNQSSNSSKEEELTNYEIGQTEEKVLKAPGEVKRLTVSVVIDGTLNDAEKTTIKNIVAAATGYDEQRGDQINIEALAFNNEDKLKAQQEIEALQKQIEQQQKIKMYAYIGAAALAFLTFLILMLRRRRRNKEEAELVAQTPQGIDVVISDVLPKQPASYEPLLSDSDEEMDLEKEIRNYAAKKPEQVVELIKTWLAEDER